MDSALSRGKMSRLKLCTEPWLLFCVFMITNEQIFTKASISLAENTPVNGYVVRILRFYCNMAHRAAQLCFI